MAQAFKLHVDGAPARGPWAVVNLLLQAGWRAALSEPSLGGWVTSHSPSPGTASPTGPGSPPCGSPSAVERGPRVRAPAALYPALPGVLEVGSGSPRVSSATQVSVSLPAVLCPRPTRLAWPALGPRTYRPEVPVELAVLPQVGQEARSRPGGLLTVGAAGRRQGSAG